MSDTSELFQKKPMAFIGNLEPKDKGQHYQVLCPRCKKREAYIYKTGTIIKCNRVNNCNYEISIHDHVGEERFKEIANGQSFSNTKNKIKNTQETIQRIEKPKEYKDFTSLFNEQVKDFKNETIKGEGNKKLVSYLKNRGIRDIYFTLSDENNITYNLFGYCKEKKAITFPFRSENKIIGIQKVYYKQDKSNKFIETGSKKDYPMFLYECLHLNRSRGITQKKLAIFEGQFDALSVILNFNYPAVSLEGATCNIEKQNKIKEVGFDDIIYCLDYDGDKENYKATTYKLAEELAGNDFKKVRFLDPVELFNYAKSKNPLLEKNVKLDMNDLVSKYELLENEFLELLKKSKPVYKFLIEKEKINAK